MLKSRGGREENEKLLLSVKETCGLTGLSERTVRTLMAENDFTVRIGRRTLVHKKKFEKWLEKTGDLNIFLERVNILMYL